MIKVDKNKIRKIFKVSIITIILITLFSPSITVAIKTKDIAENNNFIRFTEDVFYAQKNLTIEYFFSKWTPLDLVFIIIKDPDDRIIQIFSNLTTREGALQTRELGDCPLLGTYTVYMYKGVFSRFTMEERYFSIAQDNPVAFPSSGPMVLCEDYTQVTLPENYCVFGTENCFTDETMLIYYNWDGHTEAHLSLYNPDDIQVAYWKDLTLGIHRVEYGPSDEIGNWTILLIKDKDPAKYKMRVDGPGSILHADWLRLYLAKHRKFAIVVTGPNKQNDVYDEFLRTTDYVVKVLGKCYYAQPNIYYLNDGNASNYNSTQYFVRKGDNTIENIGFAFQIWLADRVRTHRNASVVVYFATHGKQYGIQVKNGIISPSMLSGWIDIAMEEWQPGKYGGMNIVIESCYSGVFIQTAGNVCGPRRIVVTSTDGVGPSHAWPSGPSIFSEFFVWFMESPRRFCVQAAFHWTVWCIYEWINPHYIKEKKFYPLIDDQYSGYFYW